LGINRNKVLDAARKHQSRGQYDKAIAQYKKLVEADKRDVRSLLKIGDLYVRKGDRGSAIDTYRSVADHYAQQGFFLKAIAVFKQILKLDPSRLDAQVQLGEMYEQLQLISDAMSVFEDVSNGFMRAGDTDEALRMLGKMVELDPEHIPVRIKYAEALSRAGRTQAAADEFEQGAQLLKDQGRLDDYIKVAERLLYHRSNDVRVAKDLAQTYIERRDPKRALAKLQICFKADPRGYVELLDEVARLPGVKHVRVASGMTRLIFFPDLPQDFVQVQLEMQSGTAPEVRDSAISRVENTLLEMNEEYNAEHEGEPPLVLHLGVFTRGETGARDHSVPSSADFAAWMARRSTTMVKVRPASGVVVGLRGSSIRTRTSAKPRSS